MREKKIVNSKCGPKEFTPIFKSAYKGSIRALKMLLCAGADLSIKNKMGESVIQALNQGNLDTNKRNPNNKIFTDDRYEECRTFLNNWGNKKERVIDINFKAYVPPNKRDIKEEKKITDVNEDILSLDIEDFLSVYKSSDEIINYINNNESPNETLVDIVISSAERGEDSFNKMFKFLPNIDDENLTYLINDDTLLDYSVYDAPYTKKEINKLRRKFLFDEI